MQNHPELNWSAPIIPGVSIAGIPLGITLNDFLILIAQHTHNEEDTNFVQFANSPRLCFESNKNGFDVRAIDIKKNYDWQDMVMGLDFSDGLLSFIEVNLTNWYSCNYSGKMFNHIGLGESAISLLDYYQTTIYDEVSEWLYFCGGHPSIRVAGSSCSLESDPDQKICSIGIASFAFLL